MSKYFLEREYLPLRSNCFQVLDPPRVKKGIWNQCVQPVVAQRESQLSKQGADEKGNSDERQLYVIQIPD